MANCICGSKRTLTVSAKCADMCSTNASYGNLESDGYVPRDIGIGGGDYIEFEVCLACGKIQGWEPVPHPKLAEALEGA